MNFSLRSHIALDFGTTSCLIMRSGEIVLQEPTVVAIDTENMALVASGNHAKQMLGRTSGGIIARRPMRNGGVANYQLAFQLLTSFLDTALGSSRFIRPHITVAVPSGLHSIEERALIKALEEYGAAAIHIVPEALAAARGAGLPVDKSLGSVIVNLGGGTAEIALIAQGKIVSSASHVGTGDALQESIVRYVRDKKHILMSEQTAEEVKMSIGNALRDSAEESMLVSGKRIDKDAVDSCELTVREVHEAIRPVLDAILDALRKVLRDAPDALAADVAEAGIALSGGTAQLANIDVFLTKSLRIPCYIVEDPVSCVVRGLS